MSEGGDNSPLERTAPGVRFNEDGFNLIEIPRVDVDLNTVQADQLAAYENAVEEQQRQRHEQQRGQQGEEQQAKQQRQNGEEGADFNDNESGKKDKHEEGHEGKEEGGFVPRGSTPELRGHQDKHSWAMQQIYNPRKPIALAPLRWNLKKIEHDYADHIKSMENSVGETEAALKAKHRDEAKKLRTRIERDIEKAKVNVPGGLNGRIRKLQHSEENLRSLGRKEQADAVKKRIPPLEARFWNDKLGGEGGALQVAKRRERKLREKQTVELGRARAETRG